MPRCHIPSIACFAHTAVPGTTLPGWSSLPGLPSDAAAAAANNERSSLADAVEPATIISAGGTLPSLLLEAEPGTKPLLPVVCAEQDGSDAREVSGVVCGIAAAVLLCR